MQIHTVLVNSPYTNVVTVDIELEDGNVSGPLVLFFCVDVCKQPVIMHFWVFLMRHGTTRSVDGQGARSIARE